MKQFNLANFVFADAILTADMQYTTTSDDWIIVSDEDIAQISTAITSGGTVWLDNGKLKTSGKAPCQVHRWDGTAWIIDTEQQASLLAEQRQQVRDKINALRDEKSAGGVYVEQLGKWFDSDSKAQGKLLGLKATMDLVGDDMTVDWTCADNTDFTGFGKPQLTAVIATILQAENHNHTVARQHKAALEQSDNPLDYDYSGGWTQCYHDYLAEQGNE